MTLRAIRKGECPICGDLGRQNSNPCKKDDTKQLLLCRSAVKYATLHAPGYSFRGNTQCGTWAKFIPSQSLRQDKKYVPTRKSKGLTLTPSKKVASLSETERDTLYRKLIDTLDLTQNHIDTLQARGLSKEDIREGLYRSATKFQKVGKVFRGIPGVLRNGALNVHDSCIIAPVINENGLVTALHARLDNEEEGRYRWLTSRTSKYEDDPTPHIDNELPVRVIPLEGTHTDIWAVEGVSFKPHLTHLYMKMPVIGASGGNFCTSKELVERALTSLREKSGATRITIPLDAGDVKNKLVMRRLLKTVDLFTSLQFNVRFAWWGQVNKSFHDFDELNKEWLNHLTYLTFEEIKELGSKWGSFDRLKKDHYAKKRKSCIQEISEVDAPELTAQQRWAKNNTAREQSVLHGLYHPPDLVVDASEKFLPSLIKPTKDATFIAIKSPKGSGKSFQIKHLKDYYCGYEEVVTHNHPTTSEQLSLLDNNPATCATAATSKTTKKEKEVVIQKGLGFKFLTFNPRVALGKAQSEAWGHTWIEDTELSAAAQLGIQVSRKSALGELPELGACADSLWKFFDRDWSKTLLVIDEVELFLSHVLTSSTCKEKRSLILQTFKVKLRELLNSNGKLVIADADLSSATLEFFDELLDVQPYLITHDYKGSPWDVDLYLGKQDKLYEKLKIYLTNNPDKNVAIACSSKRECAAIDRTLREEIKGMNEQHAVITIHGDNSCEQFQKEFIKNINPCLERYKPRVLLYTSSLGVGCSIDTPHFHHVFGFYSGVIEPSQFRQMLARVRQPVARSVWVKERASARSHSKNFTPKDVAASNTANFGSLQEQLEVLIGAKENNQHFNALNKHDLLEIKQRIDALLEQDDWDNPFIRLRYKLDARRNFCLHQMALQLRLELIEEGHTIVDFDYDEGTEIGDFLREQKEIMKREESKAIASCPNITLESALHLSKKPYKSFTERAQIEKAFLTQELPGLELTSDMVYSLKFKDGGSFYSTIKKYFLFTHPEARKRSFQKRTRKRVHATQGIPFLPDFTSSDAGIKLLYDLGLEPFTKPEFSYHKDAPEVILLFEKAMTHKRKLWSLLGVRATSNTSPIKLIELLLNVLGLRKKSYGESQKGGVKRRYYTIDTSILFCTYRLQILEALKRKHLESHNQDCERARQKTEQLKDSNRSNADLSLLPDEYQSYEALHDVCDLIKACTSQEMLADLLECDIPRLVFTLAARLLPQEIRAKLSRWVQALREHQQNTSIEGYAR